MTLYNNDKLRLLKNSYYWWDVIMRGLITLGILIPMPSIIFLKNNLDFLLLPFTLFCILMVCFYQWKDDNLSCIKTNLPKEQNLDIVKQSLVNLKWEYNIGSNKIELTLNKYILKFLNPTIIIENNKILYNFKYHSTSKTGRLPFFFGISYYLKRNFENELKRKVFKIKANA